MIFLGQPFNVEHCFEGELLFCHPILWVCNADIVCTLVNPFKTKNQEKHIAGAHKKSHFNAESKFSYDIFKYAFPCIISIKHRHITYLSLVIYHFFQQLTLLIGLYWSHHKHNKYMQFLKVILCICFLFILYNDYACHVSLFIVICNSYHLKTTNYVLVIDRSLKRIQHGTHLNVYVKI